MDDDVTGEVTELLQDLTQKLEGILEGPGLDLERHEARPGRSSLVARTERSPA